MTSPTTPQGREEGEGFFDDHGRWWPDDAEWCDRCQGNGELVTDWDRYMAGDMDASGEEYVEACPDCGGEGYHPPTPKDETPNTKDSSHG